MATIGAAFVAVIILIGIIIAVASNPGKPPAPAVEDILVDAALTCGIFFYQNHELCCFLYCYKYCRQATGVAPIVILTIES